MRKPRPSSPRKPRKTIVRSSKGSSVQSARGAVKPKQKTEEKLSGQESKEEQISSGFVERGSFQWLAGKRKAKLKSSVIYVDSEFGPLEAPEGFVTDFASIPRPLWRMDSPIEHDIVLPSVIHDWLYELRGSTGISRKQADDIFYRAMRDEGAPLWKAWSRYWAVRVGSRTSKGWPKGMNK